MLRAPPARRTFAEISQRVATNRAANDRRNARIEGGAATNHLSGAFGIRNFPSELPTTAQKGSSQQYFFLKSHQFIPTNEVAAKLLGIVGMSPESIVKQWFSQPSVEILALKPPN
mgnify:CR=1 FL=1